MLIKSKYSILTYLVLCL